MNCENCRANGICDGIVGDCEQTDKIADKIYQKGRADMFEEILAELRNFICSDNRGSCDYFIVDQIESYMFALAEQMQKGKKMSKSGKEILEEMAQEDYELWIWIQQSHLSEEQWKWLIENFEIKRKRGRE